MDEKETVKKITDKEIQSAKKVDLDYYKNTIFEVNSIEYVNKRTVTVQNTIFNRLGEIQ